MAKGSVPPPPEATGSVGEFYRWLARHECLEEFGLAIWKHLVFSRYPAEFSVEALCGAFPGAQRLRESFLPVFSLSRPGGPDGRRLDGWFVILPTESPNIFSLTTLSDSDYWLRVVVPFVRSRYPRLAPLHLMQSDLRRGLDVLQHALPAGRALKVIRAAAKERIVVDGVEGHRIRRERSSVIYTNETLEGAFQLARERGQRFRRLMVDLETTEHGEKIARVRVSNEGWVAWTILLEAPSAALEHGLISGAARRLELFRNRGREERDYKPAEPLQIAFEVRLFDDRRLVRAFGKLMLGYPRAVKALLHQNPYYHMSLSDEGDGSAFDLWILNPQRILVVPRLRASEAAINRLVSYIVENFREGQVEAYRGDD